MSVMKFGDAIQDAIAQSMGEDPRIILIGEDIHAYRMKLFIQFGEERLLATPISESSFLGAAVTASMAGLRPIVDLTLVDFIAVAMDPLMNHAAKLEVFSGGKWNAPLVVWAACGGGYGDGGQHEQSLWGWLAHIPGLTVAVPSNPADAGGLMTAAVEHDSPVIFLEHKMLADYWLEWMGGSWRETIHIDVPAEGTVGPVPKKWAAIPFGKAAIRKEGNDLTLFSVGVGVHQSMEAAAVLEKHDVSAGVVDLRSVSPLDVETICNTMAVTGNMIVVDEDYRRFGLSAEVAAVALEAGLKFNYRRVCTNGTIPYARRLEEQVLPNTNRILEAVVDLLDTNLPI